jgi:hypothetical protein
MARRDESEAIVNAVRLGWYLAEVRGRKGQDGPRGQVAAA